MQIETNKFNFPLTTKPGQAIGMFETIYSQKSAYLYRIKRDKAASGYFIRMKNWFKFQEETEEQFTEALINFKRYVLSEYIKKVYFPLQIDQQNLLKKEKKEIRDK